ncbi:hypothetical protein SARC_13962 [Sphaeroforma arctica JP610]|uniref:N-acetyltransferase domain-containing protein n=1 Tax=Sphaeroforma arctica JP610 TaxID=667725 RepID=A0A0L0F9U2_9EUKA|nr:hypothetical protein SARC_13962 [Sphaeroforma arctica JP610]KNC73480.1 hypothetical protein SARC_13962 [Sphaeroforma arctica JP610]|eukprot:XP_014147382.1 hypothetical protein SARC_13962 [Sphaeroforma arctica JP610]
MVLRRMHPADVNPFLSYRSDAVVAQYQGWDLMTTQQATAFISTMQAMHTLQPDGWLQISVALADTDELLGDIGLHLLPCQPVLHLLPSQSGLHPLPSSSASVEVGFSFAQESQGKGYASEALRGLIRSLSSRHSIDRIEATTDTRNTRCIQLLKKLGFSLVRTHEAVMFKGELCTEETYEKHVVP